MTRTQKQTKDEPKKDSDIKEAATGPSGKPVGVTTPGGTNASATQPTSRRSLGTKEVIPFEWKLLGESHGMILTLFKAVDRTEVDAQFERVRKEGYYKDLRVLEAKAKIKQPKSVNAPDMTPKSAKTTRKAAPAKMKKTVIRSIKLTMRKKSPAAEKKAAEAAGKSTAKSTGKKKTTKSTKTTKTTKITKAAKTTRAARATKKKAATAKPKKKAATKKKKAKR